MGVYTRRKKASFRKDEVFDFPTGSALIKTFYYPIDERVNLGQETNGNEIIAEEADGWQTVSYAWNEQDEAFIESW